MAMVYEGLLMLLVVQGQVRMTMRRRRWDNWERILSSRQAVAGNWTGTCGPQRRTVIKNKR